MNCWTATLLGLACATTSANAQRFNTVVIDPGHGGIDSGATWYGTEEKDLTLPVSKLLREQLLARGVKNVLLTRDEDVVMGLSERAQFSNKQDRPIFVSIHFNANLDRSVTGIELYVMPKSEKAKELAEAIGEPLKGVGRRYRGLRPTNLKVLRATNHPAIIVEGGFLSNRGENWFIRTEGYQRRLTKAIADGIIAYRDSSPAKIVVADATSPPAPSPALKPTAAPPRPTPKLTPVPPEELPKPPVPPRAPSPPPAPAPTPAVVSGSGFRVQFGAFSQPKYATTLTNELQGKGIEVVVLQRHGQTKTFHRVVSQRTFPDAKAAGRWADDLVQNQVVEQTAVTR